MMIRCCLFLMAFAGVFLNVIAQHQPNLDPRNAVAADEFFSILVTPTEVEGRANLFVDWQPAVVFLSQGKFASGIILNYDVLNHTLLVLVEDKEFSLNPIAVDSILLDNAPQVLINPIILEGIEGDQLMLRVYHGPHMSLFRNTLASVPESDIRTSSITELKYVSSDLQIDQEQTYLLLDRTNNEFLELKRKELKKWENGDQVLKFVKNQNLDLKNEADLIKTVRYYEQLINESR